MNTISRRLVPIVLLLLVFQAVIPQAAAYAGEESPGENAGTLYLPDGKAGQSYEYQFQTEGGLAPLPWTVTAGELPSGISLSASGKLKGMPAAPRREAYTFVIEVADSSQPSQRFAQPFALRIQAAPLRMVMAPNPLKIVSPTIDSPDEPGQTTRPAVAVLGDRAEQNAGAGNRATAPVTWPYNASLTKPAAQEQAAANGEGQLYKNNPLPSKDESTRALDPAYFVKIYESPNARSNSVQDKEEITKYGDDAKVSGKLIYDGRTPGLNNPQLTVDEKSKLTIVPDVSGRDIVFNTIRMEATLSSADTVQNVEITNYSQVGKEPPAEAIAIGVSFETAEDVLYRLITIQKKATDILKDTLKYSKPGEIPADELEKLDSPSNDHLNRARTAFKTYGQEIDNNITFLVTEANRDVIRHVANSVFHINRDSLIAIARQFGKDLSLIAESQNAQRDEATIRLLKRTQDVYADFKSARAEIRAMTQRYNENASSDFIDTRSTKRRRLVKELKDFQANGQVEEAASTARELYAFDKSSEAIADLRQTKFPKGEILLGAVKAQDGDTLTLTVSVQNPDKKGTPNASVFPITIKKYGVKVHLASSFMFIKRLNLMDKDLMPTDGSTPLTEVNFAPSPGVSYGMTFFKRGDSGGDKFLRALAPTVGINVSFMNFNDPGFDLASNMFTNTNGANVQVGAGPVASLFNNKLHFSYGWNLNADRKRNYFGIGFGFIEIAKEVSKYLKSSTQ